MFGEKPKVFGHFSLEILIPRFMQKKEKGLSAFFRKGNIMGTETITPEGTDQASQVKSFDYSLGNGGFLTSPCPPGKVFTKEQLNDEQIEIGKTAYNFCINKVVPMEDKINEKACDENGEPFMVKLFQEAGELGLLAIGIPEKYEGMEMDLATNMHMVERLSTHASGFANTVLPHIGIGTMPILLFGNEEQKAKYLSKLASGEWLGCYALTEPGSGSDALSGRTEAELDGDHYVLNGAKQFITNGAWAQVATVFTRIEGKYSALIVELDWPGVTRGIEEKKMGIQGSSATALIFEDVKVPKENLLGKIGDAANIALNILNLGRLELGFGCQGPCKRLVDDAIKYGRDRKQFGRSILDFDMQKARLADMVARCYQVDAINYRTVAPIDQKMESRPSHSDYSKHIISSIRSYAMEVSICKVFASEALYENGENCIKLFGGYGYIKEYKVEETFRDSFINMIYEGTNDINRLVIFDFLVRNIYGGGIPYREFIEEVESSLRSRQFSYPVDDSILLREKECLYAAKYIAAYLVQRAILHYGKDISHQQQAIQALSDIMIDLYVMDSVLARVHYQIDTNGKNESKAEVAIAQITVASKLSNIRRLAQDLLPDITEKYQYSKTLEKLSWLIEQTHYQQHIFPLKRLIADTVIEKEKYCF